MIPVIKYWYMLLYHAYSLGSSLSFHQAPVQNLLILWQKNVYKKYLFTLILFGTLTFSGSSSFFFSNSVLRFLRSVFMTFIVDMISFWLFRISFNLPRILSLWLKWNKENIISTWTRWVIRNVFIWKWHEKMNDFAFVI